MQREIPWSAVLILAVAVAAVGALVLLGAFVDPSLCACSGTELS